MPRGRLRTDERAVRFVEVVVTGPKSWSLAAALHPGIAAGYDAAQDRAANQIITWLADHATTRVGPAGGQVQVPVERFEAVTVRHYTSRAGRSAWNAADLRGQAERLLAAAGVVAEAAVRGELAEDLTARALARCLPLLTREGVPEHVRAWTSPAVLEVEADLAARLAVRGTHHGADADLRSDRVANLELLDAGQAATAAALAGNRPLVVVEGAAGAGKTTTLAAARRLLEQQGRRLVVVTPTLKAARVASAEVGATAGSAAWLAFQHGWRWTDDGAWTRLIPGEVDPATGQLYAGPEENARLRAGDVLLVDEAGMLDQDIARALLVVADECRVPVALVGGSWPRWAAGACWTSPPAESTRPVT